MPFITSQCLRRETSDREAVLPAGTQNLAFMGQFCEVPDDMVFTVEYWSARRSLPSMACSICN